MSDLGDYFPKELKRDAIDRICKGLSHVVYYPQHEFDDPHHKYFIIVAIDEKEENAAIVYINSEVNNNVAWNPYLKSMHLKILTKDHSWLPHDSFIDCSKITIRPVAEIRSYLEKSFNKHYKGTVKDGLFNNVLQTVCTSKNIPPKHKKQFNLY